MTKAIAPTNKLTVLTAILLFLGILGTATHGLAASFLPEDKYSAVILSYYRIGEDAYPEANLRTEQFLAHIQEISDGSYNVLSLTEIIDAIRNHKELPARTIALTFDGAYKSVLQNAVPVLLEKNIPFTIFYSSNSLDDASSETMTWNDLKELSRHKNVTIGIMPASYANLSDESGESIRGQINKTLIRYRETFSSDPEFFSYPFGEYSESYRDIIDNLNFKAAFGLQSGAVYDGADFSALPRFSMTERYGDLERFKLVANALPLPAYDIEPQDRRLTTAEPAIGFSIPETLKAEAKDLSCFLPEQQQPTLEVLGNRVELRLKDIPVSSRLRINCTMPGPHNNEQDTEQWRWFGMILTGTEPANGSDLNNPQPDVPQ